MTYIFAVITKVCEPETGGNLANFLNVYREVEEYSEANDWMGRWERVPVIESITFNYRQPVFETGEILILDEEYGREICGLGRKPSKWDVEVEYFTDLDAAVKRAREVSG